MKKFVQTITFIVIGILLIGIFPNVSNACSCLEVASAEDEFERSQAVFSGKVLEVKKRRNLSGFTYRTVLFEVTNSWKGVSQSQIMITTGEGGGDCGIDFIEGKEYLVYAKKSSMYEAKTLVTIICDRTNELSLLQEDLQVLGPGQKPSEESADISLELLRSAAITMFQFLLK